MSHHDEYIDYSCSTSVERLARDVETRLREWHVDQGSDRHVSVTGNHSPSQTNSKRGLLEENDGVNRRQQRLIRSDTIQWNINFFLPQQHQRINCSVDLELVLWDRPSNSDGHAMEKLTSTATSTTSPTICTPPLASRVPVIPKTKKKKKRLMKGIKKMSSSLKSYSQDSSSTVSRDSTVDSEMLLEDDKLPFALQRQQQQMPTANTDVFENFSTLFGIGQHITLSPIDPTTGLSQELLSFLYLSVLQRHDKVTTAPEMVQSILSGWLQVALNMAASYSQCYFPMIAVWGRYQADNSLTRRQDFDRHLLAAKQQNSNATTAEVVRNLSIYPCWMPTSLSSGNEDEREHQLQAVLGSPPRRRQRPLHTKNQHYLPPLLTGQLRSEDCTATFSCSVLTADKKWTQQQQQQQPTWTTWGCMLQRHVLQTNHDLPDNVKPPVVNLWAARHVYVWCKPLTKHCHHRSARSGDKSLLEWRQRRRSSKSGGLAVDLTSEEMENYRRECRQVAFSLLERAAGTTDMEPLWGPTEDPVNCLQAAVAWDRRTSPSLPQSSSPLIPATIKDVKAEPLLTLPLATRSRVSISKEDDREVADALEASVLDPRSCNSFVLKTYFDPDATQASLAATQRCVLAALIRTATLPRETLWSHLVDSEVIQRWDSHAGNHIASTLAIRASVDPTTHALVAAMDWKDSVENMLESWRAEEVVQHVMNGGLALQFPDPPDGRMVEFRMEDWRALFKSAPPGRLLSLLFVHMANVHSPPSMALVWKCFVEELRRRGDANESLPNMNYVPGLDPPLDSIPMKRSISTVGGKANLAAHVHSKEPDPDDGHCLIGQKLQVCVRFFLLLTKYALFCV